MARPVPGFLPRHFQLLGQSGQESFLVLFSAFDRAGTWCFLHVKRGRKREEADGKMGGGPVQ